MKFFTFTCLFAAVFAFACASNSTWGVRYANDFLLLNDTIRNNGVAGSYSTYTVNFPYSGQTNTRIISAIYVIDKYTNGRGADATLWSGGPGFTFASINLKTQYGQGVNSTIQIYGR